MLYVSPCGLEVVADDFAPTPEDTETMEAQAIAWGVVECAALPRVQVRTMPVNGWYDSSGTSVGGQSWCGDPFNPHKVIIGRTDYYGGLRGGGFVHELHHQSECPWENRAHEGWHDPDAEGFTPYQRITHANHLDPAPL